VPAGLPAALTGPTTGLPRVPTCRLGRTIPAWGTKVSKTISGGNWPRSYIGEIVVEVDSKVCAHDAFANRVGSACNHIACRIQGR